MTYIKNPSSIEAKSFRLIQEQIDRDYPGYQFHNEMEESIIKRAIHTSGDFDYLFNLEFSSDILEKLMFIFQNKGKIITDSPLSLNGINKRVLDQLEVSYENLLEHEVIGRELRSDEEERLVTKILSISDERPTLLALGTASGVLEVLLPHLEKKKTPIQAVLALTTGYSRARMDKELLTESTFPWLRSRGAKGGSTIVVSTINAVLYQLQLVETQDYKRYATPDKEFSVDTEASGDYKYQQLNIGAIDTDALTKAMDPSHAAIVSRVITTSADQDYANNLVFSKQVLEAIQSVIRQGGYLFSDTTMVLAGLDTEALDSWGVRYECLVNRPEIFEEAKQKKITRSMAAVEHAAKIEGPKIFVFGNAPTSIFKVLDMVEEGRLHPEAVIGVPVGFVGAAESKQQLHESEIPSIAALGAKGGSGIAASIVNAILEQMKLE